MEDWNCQFISWLSRLGERYFNENLSSFDAKKLKEDIKENLIKKEIRGWMTVFMT